jgi:predicted neutral ceramidase superfamily lipid hydrolase
MAGFIATEIAPTFWFLAFALFLFFALALLKRFVETAFSPNSGRVPGRGYFYDDSPILLQAGMASSFAALIILCLYLTSEEASQLYSTPFLLWLTLPITLHWIVFLWLQATRGKINEDPIDWAISDKTSLICAFACIFLFAFAI